MESKNVLIAVILSTIVLIFWSTFFEPPVIEQQNDENEISKKQDASSPSIDTKEVKNEITRNEALKNTTRIKRHI